MARIGLLSFAVCFGLLVLFVSAQEPVSAQAQNSFDASILEASAISVDIPLPVDTPVLTWLLRHKMKFDEDFLVKRFLKGDTTSRTIYSAIYGEGTGYILSKGGEVEAHLKVFDFGFEYQKAAKNINKGVAKFIPDPESGKVEKGSTMFDQGYTYFEYKSGLKGTWKYVFPPDEGKVAAMKILKDVVGEIPDQGSDFTFEYEAVIDKSEEGLFHLNVNKYFRGVQLLDDYIQISLDADMQLVGFSYFWDNRTVPGPSPPGDRRIVDSSFAVNQAKKWVIQNSNGAAPYLTLVQIRLGYITLRGDYITIVPAWIMSCAWQHKVGADLDVEAPGLRKNRPTMKRFVEWLEKYDVYIAIEGITGRPMEL
ncbi:hypothetical protein J7K50_00635 [bacterium]|nr:hypothetical protein [bacterium]